jgi:hypothetical protein
MRVGLIRGPKKNLKITHPEFRLRMVKAVNREF